MNTKNKLIINSLLKIAEKQQKVLVRLAQEVANQVDNAMETFIKQNLSSWGIPLEIAFRDNHTSETQAGSKHYDVTINITLNDKSKKTLADDAQRGLAAFLNRKFDAASAGQDPKWKIFAGYTATFNVTAN